MSDIKKRELVLNSLGELITSYIIVFRSNTEFSEPVERIRSSILHNFSRPDYALDEAIRELPFHYDYLRKLFKKEVGMSPLEYMTSLRMKSAETLLTAMWTNEYSISEIAQMCGFTFEKNFDYPYMAVSITDFWRRWHISLGAWFRDYIYIPLGGSRVETKKIIRNLFVVWLFTGIWHGASWTFIVWGLFHGVVQVIEKYVLKDLLAKIPRIIRIVFTQLLVLIGWVFFFSPSLGSAFLWLGKMLGIGAAGALDATAKYYLGSSAIILVIGALAAYPLGATFGTRMLKGKNQTPVYLSVAWYAVLLILCIAGMMSSTYSSFLYFQF